MLIKTLFDGQMIYSQLSQKANRKNTKRFTLLREFRYQESGFALKLFFDKMFFRC